MKRQLTALFGGLCLSIVAAPAFAGGYSYYSAPFICDNAVSAYSYNYPTYNATSYGSVYTAPTTYSYVPAYSYSYTAPRYSRTYTYDEWRRHERRKARRAARRAHRQTHYGTHYTYW